MCILFGHQGPTILLVVIDTPESPGDHGASSEVTVGIVKGVRCSRGFEEEERNEYECFCQDIGLVLVSVDAKGLKSGEYDQDHGPAMVDGERDLHES